MDQVAGARGRRVAAAAVALVVAGGVALWPAVADAASRNVTVGPGGALSFSPSQLTIEVGDTVVWRNDEGNHNVHANDGSFSSGAPRADDWRYEHTFTRAGTFSYVCSVHFQMKGSVTVTAASEPSPTPTATTPTSTPSASPTPRPSPTATASPSPRPTATTTTTPSRTPSPTSAPAPTPTRTTTAPSAAPAPTSTTTSAPPVAPTATTDPTPSEDDPTASTPSPTEPSATTDVSTPTDASETTEAASPSPSSSPTGDTTGLVAVGDPGSGGLGTAGIVAVGGGVALLGGAGLWAFRRRG